MSTNLIKDDPELKVILRSLDSVKRNDQFKGWRASFLARYESFLDESGTTAAKKKYRRFSKSVRVLVGVILQVKGFIDQGDLKVGESTVKARQTLTELSRQITAVIDEQDALLPTTGHMEKELGYSKFTMGAVLVRDNFSEYRRLSMCCESLSRLCCSLQNIADHQVMGEMVRFGVKFQAFCDIISDLGLRRALAKCNELDPVLEERRADGGGDEPQPLADETHRGVLRTLKPEAPEDEDSTVAETASMSTATESCSKNEEARKELDLGYDEEKEDSLVAAKLELLTEARNCENDKAQEMRSASYKSGTSNVLCTSRSSSELPPTRDALSRSCNVAESNPFSSPRTTQRLLKKKVVKVPFIHLKDDPAHRRMNRSMNDYYHNPEDLAARRRARGVQRNQEAKIESNESESVATDDEEASLERRDSNANGKARTTTADSESDESESVATDDEDSVEQPDTDDKPKEKAQPSGRANNNNVEVNDETSEPKTFCGMSYEDENDKSNECPQAAGIGSPSDEPKNATEQSMWQSVRPSTYRGMSFDDEASGHIEEPVPRVPAMKQPDLIVVPVRPTTVRGMSFDDVEPNKPPGSPSVVGEEPELVTLRCLSSVTPKFNPIEKMQIECCPTCGAKKVPNVRTKSKQTRKKTEGTLSSVTKKAETTPVVADELIEERRRKCYMWYARLRMPNREQMKNKIAALPDSCDVTVEDVELLPWVAGGSRLNVSETNMLFLEVVSAFRSTTTGLFFSSYSE